MIFHQIEWFLIKLLKWVSQNRGIYLDSPDLLGRKSESAILVRRERKLYIPVSPIAKDRVKEIMFQAKEVKLHIHVSTCNNNLEVHVFLLRNLCRRMQQIT